VPIRQSPHRASGHRSSSRGEGLSMGMEYPSAHLAIPGGRFGAPRMTDATGRPGAGEEER
jgi:hypothetical protein